MSEPGFSCASEQAGFAQFASCARWLLHVRMLRALRRRFLPWDLIIVIAGSSEFVVGFGSCVWDWRGKRRRSNAVEGCRECVVEELGAMTARSSAAAWFFFAVTGRADFF